MTSNWRVNLFTEFCPAEFVPAVNLETSAGHHGEELLSVLAVVSVQLVGALPPGEQYLRRALKGTPLGADGEIVPGVHDDVARRELGEGRVGAEHQVPPGHQVQGRQPGQGGNPRSPGLRGIKQFLVDQVIDHFLINFLQNLTARQLISYGATFVYFIVNDVFSSK